MELPTNHPFMEPLPLYQPWSIKVQRALCPKAFIVAEDYGVITEMSPDSHDSATGIDVLEHLVECHNQWLKEKQRKRK